MRLASVGLALLLSAVSAQSENVIGEAYADDDGTLRYREVHTCSVNGEECLVEYRYPGGDLFARKRVDYRKSMQSPSLHIEDLRVGETLQIDGDFYSDVVVDAGFDHYVRLRWDALAGGETVKFPFLVAGRSKPLDMLAKQGDDSVCPDTRMCLVITVDNWLLAAIVSPIRLEYDESSRRLLQFQGVSNIRDEQGKSQQVKIDYRYPADALDTAS